MKKVFMFLGLASVAVLMSSCALLGTGMVYEGITVPHSVTSNTISDNAKVGKSNYISVLGIVAVGDGGVNAAAKNAGIKKSVMWTSKKQVSLAFSLNLKLLFTGNKPRIFHDGGCL